MRKRERGRSATFWISGTKALVFSADLHATKATAQDLFWTNASISCTRETKRSSLASRVGSTQWLLRGQKRACNLLPSHHAVAHSHMPSSARLARSCLPGRSGSKLFTYFWLFTHFWLFTQLTSPLPLPCPPRCRAQQPPRQTLGCWRTRGEREPPRR